VASIRALPRLPPTPPHHHGRLGIFAWKGGTNLRVCLVTLQGNGKFEITQSKYRLSEEQKQDEGQKLFDFCAECLKTFIDTNLDETSLKDGERLPLGFTVSRHSISSTSPYRLPWSARVPREADYLDVNVSSSRTHARKLCHYRKSIVVPNTRVWAVIRQERIDHGELIRWTKGFGAPNTEGRDVAAMFRESLKKNVSIRSPDATLC
jgi:hexokinase